MDTLEVGDMLLCKGYNNSDAEDVGMIIKISDTYGETNVRKMTLYWLSGSDNVINTEMDIIYDPLDTFEEWCDNHDDGTTWQKL